MSRVITTDILVVGGGGAAARAALEAKRAGARVVLAVKGRFGALGTRGAGATASANSESGRFRARGVRHVHYPDQDINPDKVYADIVQAGMGTADPKLAAILAYEAEASAKALSALGVLWNAGFGMKSHGVPIMMSLEHAIRDTDTVIMDKTMITSLLTLNGRCVGAMAVYESRQVYVIRAKGVILGTGGNGQLFMFNLSPNCVTGDGYAMGYNAGAALMNMEFFQIFLGSVYPSLNQMSLWVSTYAGQATNRHGHAFLADYLPAAGTVEECIRQKIRHNPFSTRDTLSRYINISMVKETIAGRANENDAFYLDLTKADIPEETLDYWRYRGLDMQRAPIQINTVQQCCNGGFRVDDNSETTLPGLYAVGETGTGYHGADRLGGNMLAVSQVFGARAGQHAAKVAAGMAQIEPDRDQVREEEAHIKALRIRKGTHKPVVPKAELQRRAWENLLVVRTASGLGNFIEKVEELRVASLPHTFVETGLELQQALELENLLLNGEIVAQAALLRTECRGGHYREDFPYQDDANWRKVILVKKDSDKIKLTPFLLDPDWTDREGDMGHKRWG
jgi:fumarate reductase (CoM/CoB) subunit A